MTVTVELTGCVPPPLPFVDDPPDPPQPLAKSKADATSIPMRMHLTRRFLGAVKQKKSAARTAGARNGNPSLCSEPLNLAVEMVSVVEAAPAPEGVTVAGEKEQDAPVGSPEQLKETAASNPF